MKKLAKLIGTFSVLFSLVACEDLGTLLTEEQGEAQYNAIQSYTIDNLPDIVTVNETVNMSSYRVAYELMEGISMPETRSNTTYSIYFCYNTKKNYFHQKTITKSETTSEGVKITTSTTSEKWRYLEKGIFYDVTYTKLTDPSTSSLNEEEKYYTSELRDKVTVLDLIAGDNSYSISDLVGSFTIKYAADLLLNTFMPEDYDETKINRKTDITYYSKSKSNLSLIIKDAVNFDKTALAESTNKLNVDNGKYNLNYKITINDYNYGSGKLSYNYLFKDAAGKEVSSAKSKTDYKSSKTYSVSYPDLKDYKQILEPAE